MDSLHITRDAFHGEWNYTIHPAKTKAFDGQSSYLRMSPTGRLQRRPVRLVTVALANKMSRIAWALMTRKEVYHAKGCVAAAAEALA